MKLEFYIYIKKYIIIVYHLITPLIFLSGYHVLGHSNPSFFFFPDFCPLFFLLSLQTRKDYPLTESFWIQNISCPGSDEGYDLLIRRHLLFP
jgi:hypothetical protein